MTDPSPEPITPIYRLVVTASQLKAKQFVWVVVDDAQRGVPVQTSKQTFRSMADAYDAGRGALEYWRAKMRRTHPAVDLAQPSTQQPSKRRSARISGPGGSLTSSIYSRR